ncbi:MAG: hypothetical protein COB76_00860 [Alphaproteobacteria bacterium]|nr:MAG: hypothetical protein COB76_00860 [Alphaproteobacteria bacterium]
MDNFLNIAQFFGFLSFAMSIWKLQLKSHRSIIWWDIPGGLCWAIHFYLISGYSALIINVLSSIRATAKCYLPEKYSSPMIYIIVVLIWILCFYFYQDIYSLLPPLASTIATYGLIGNSRQILSNCIFIHYIIWLIYAVALVSPFMALSTLIGMGSCLIGKFRHERTTENDTKL